MKKLRKNQNLNDIKITILRNKRKYLEDTTEIKRKLLEEKIKLMEIRRNLKEKSLNLEHNYKLDSTDKDQFFTILNRATKKLDEEEVQT